MLLIVDFKYHKIYFTALQQTFPGLLINLHTTLTTWSKFGLVTNHDIFQAPNNTGTNNFMHNSPFLKDYEVC